VIAANREKLAELLGARFVDEVPDVGGGTFAMARLARLLHERLTPNRGKRLRESTDPGWVTDPAAEPE
jgi:hypothetical protein